MRTYRETGFALVLGVLFFVLPIAAVSIPAVYHLVSGVPMMVSYGRNPTTSHVATQVELLEYALFPLLVSVLGGWLILTWKNAVIQTDDTGIRQYDLFHRLKFNAAWTELTEVSTRNDIRGGVYYVLASKTGRLDMPESAPYRSQLATEIMTRANHLDFTPWN